MIIIGIDPGTASTGWGLIKKARDGFKYLGHGVIKTSPKNTSGERLKQINNQLNYVLKKYTPVVAAVESVFFFKNLKTALPVSEARGVVLLTAAKKKLTIKQFSPLEVKMAVCGYGRADKKQVQKMVKKILNLDKEPRPDDAADALAVAICCAQCQDGLRPK